MMTLYVVRTTYDPVSVDLRHRTFATGSLREAERRYAELRGHISDWSDGNHEISLCRITFDDLPCKQLVIAILSADSLGYRRHILSEEPIRSERCQDFKWNDLHPVR